MHLRPRRRLRLLGVRLGPTGLERRGRAIGVHRVRLAERVEHARRPLGGVLLRLALGLGDSPPGVLQAPGALLLRRPACCCAAACLIWSSTLACEGWATAGSAS